VDQLPWRRDGGGRYHESAVLLYKDESEVRHKLNIELDWTRHTVQIYVACIELFVNVSMGTSALRSLAFDEEKPEKCQGFRPKGWATWMMRLVDRINRAFKVSRCELEDESEPRADQGRVDSSWATTLLLWRGHTLYQRYNFLYRFGATDSLCALVKANNDWLRDMNAELDAPAGPNELLSHLDSQHTAAIERVDRLTDERKAIDVESLGQDIAAAFEPRGEFRGDFTEPPAHWANSPTQVLVFNADGVQEMTLRQLHGEKDRFPIDLFTDRKYMGLVSVPIMQVKQVAKDGSAVVFLESLGETILMEPKPDVGQDRARELWDRLRRSKNVNVSELQSAEEDLRETKRFKPARKFLQKWKERKSQGPLRAALQYLSRKYEDSKKDKYRAAYHAIALAMNFTPAAIPTRMVKFYCYHNRGCCSVLARGTIRAFYGDGTPMCTT